MFLKCLPKPTRIESWKISLNHSEEEQIETAEYLTAVYKIDWPTWRTLNRPRG